MSDSRRVNPELNASSLRPAHGRLPKGLASFTGDIPARARGFFWVSCVLGLPILLYSIFKSLQVEPIWLLLAGATIISSAFPVRVPFARAKCQSLSITASDLFIFSAILAFSPEVAVSVAVIDSFLGSLRRTRPYRLVFNATQASIIAFSVGHLFYFLSGQTAPLDLDKIAGQGPFMASLVLCAFVYFCAGGAGVARLISLAAGNSFFKVWSGSFIWTSLAGVVGVSFAGFVFANFERAQFLAVGVTLPVVLVMIYAFKMNHDKLETLQESLVLANYDPLTGLPNRSLFRENLLAHIEEARHQGGRLALLLMDLDRFKSVNDSLGHAAGDQLLKAVAARLSEGFERDEIARLGGDEFTIVLRCTEGDDGRGALAQIQESFREPVQVQGMQFFIAPSIGVSLFPEHGSDPETLTKNADAAMYRAKETGGDRYQIYSPEMSVRFSDRISLESELREALEQDNLKLVYQPQIEISSGRIVGLEALLRWRHASRGSVSPSEFIPIAEETGLIMELEEAVLRNACREARKWVDAGLDETRIAVNLSGQHLRRRDLASLVKRILAETTLPPHLLELELTEGTLIDDVEQTVRFLNELHDIGVQFAIDDFGTGYSSLSYLKRFAIQRLKIDKSFIEDLNGRDSQDAKIASAIVSMGHSLNLRVIAEGVEDWKQLEFLRRLGCDEVQGFLLSRPVDAGRIPIILRESRRLSSVELFSPSGAAALHGARAGAH